MAGGGKGGKQQQETVQVLDPETQAYVNEFQRPLAEQGAEAALEGGPFFADMTDTQRAGIEALQGISGQLGGFGGALEDYISGIQLPEISVPSIGGLGFEATMFDPAQAEAFFNPYAEGAINVAQNERRAQDAQRANQLATRQGAFGGSRSAIFEAEAARQAEIDRAQQMMQAQDLAMQTSMGAHEGFENRGLQGAMAELQARTAAAGFGTQASIAAGEQALGQAQLGLQGFGLGLQGLGMGGNLAGQLIQAGEMERMINQNQMQEPLFRHRQALDFANSGLGPYGGTSTMFGGGTSALGSAAGGALTGFGLGGPLGAGIGGGIGLMGGLLGF